MNFEEFKSRYQKKDVIECYANLPKKPVVSVCVQAYNHERYIRKCLDGILEQDLELDFEILLGEDDSKDNTRKICLEYSQKYPDKIKLFLHDRANNIAINGSATGRFSLIYNLFNAKGQYIALCEGDDYWINKDKLKTQLSFFERNTWCSMVYHSALVVNDVDFQLGVTGVFNKSFKTAEEFILRGDIPTSSMFFNKEIIDDLPEWFCEVPGGDFGISLLALEKSDIGYQNFRGSAYRLHSGGIFSSLQNHKTLEYRISANKFALGLFANKFDSILRKSIVRRNLKIYSTTYNSEKKIANKAFLDCLKYTRNQFFWTIGQMVRKFLNVKLKTH